jgi:cytochrome P450
VRVPLPGSPFRRGRRARKDLGAWLAKVVRRYRESGAPANLIGNLMRASGESGEALADEILVAEMISFVFAGYDTSASVLASIFLCLSSRPDLYPALRDEARALGETTSGALAGQRLAEAFILETQRLHPPLLFSLRGVRRGFSFEGHDIPAGANCAVSAWYTHRMPSIFDEPTAFRPERFLPGPGGGVPKRYSSYELLPFSAGHRPCIGRRFATLELQLILNRVLRRFDLTLIPGQPDDAWFNPAMHRKHGVRVRVRRAR